MTVHSLREALADSLTLHTLAAQAGITIPQARRLMAAMAEVPIRQAIRLCKSAQNDRVRQTNRETRRGER